MGREGRSLASKAGTYCPGCGATLRSEAILCVNCGFHLVHRRVLRTRDPAADARDRPRDPTRIWLFAAFAIAAVGAVVVGGAVLFAMRPESIIGKWTGHPTSDFHGLPVIGDDISLSFGSDGVVTCSDGTSGRYAIKGDSIVIRLVKPNEDDSGIAFVSKFKIEHGWLTIDEYPLSPKPMSFRREDDSMIEAPSGRFLPSPSPTLPTGRGL